MHLWDDSGGLWRGESQWVHVHLDLCVRTLVCAAHNRCEQDVKPSLVRHTSLRHAGSDPPGM